MTHQSIHLPDIIRSKTNPRKHFDPDRMADLAASVKEHGVLQPVLVRPLGRKLGTEEGSVYELVAGERRFRAAQAAELHTIPAIVRELTDQQVLEIQCVENLQRDDLHPLEEAAGYQQLLAIKGYDVGRIAARIGRSVKYVYDRMKLTQLIPALRDVFLDGRITAGHAILLARLKPEDQKRAMGEPDHFDMGGLWTEERGLFMDSAEPEPSKAVSVRELSAWIDRNVKLEPADVDQMLLPETHRKLADAATDGEKILRITRDDTTHEVLKDGPKVILSRSWERADGLEKSKTCEHSNIGHVVIGEGRGETFLVCVAKKKCATHWPDHVKAVRAAEKEAAAVASGKKAAPAKPKKDKWQLAEEKRQREHEARQREQARFVNARPAILEAIAAAVKKASAKPTGELARLILARVQQNWQARGVKVSAYVPLGKTAEDLVRHAAFIVLNDHAHEWSAFEDFPKRAKAFGVDVQKIVDEVAPAPKPEKPAGKKGKK